MRDGATISSDHFGIHIPIASIFMTITKHIMRIHTGFPIGQEWMMMLLMVSPFISHGLICMG
jgi:hypothetical protein